MRVNDWMAKDVKAIRADDTLQSAAMCMWQNDLGALPVVDSNEKVLGMITDRDIAMAATLQRCPLDMLDVRSTMSKRLWSCRPDDTLTYAEALMRDHQVHRLPVVNAIGEIAGVISLNDIAHASLSGVRRVIASDLARTLGAISTPRQHASYAPT